jgi:hypothetical protein
MNVLSGWLAKGYLEEFRSVKGVDIDKFIERVHGELNYNIFGDKVYQVRQKKEILSKANTNFHR